jgi:hypothetical protein
VSQKQLSNQWGNYKVRKEPELEILKYVQFINIYYETKEHFSCLKYLLIRNILDWKRWSEEDSDPHGECYPDPAEDTQGIKDDFYIQICLIFHPA